MKKSVLVAFLPIILIGSNWSKLRFEVTGWSVRRRSFLSISVALLLCYLFLSVVSIYAELRRPDFYSGAQGSVVLRDERPDILPYLVPAIVSAVPGTDDFARVNSFPYGGVWYFARRIAHTDEAGWAVEEFSTHGYRIGSFLGDLALTVTPRILWPDKPNISWGRELAVLVGSAVDSESATTSFGLPMAAAYYWKGGLLGVFLGMATSGAMLGLLWRFYSPLFGKSILGTSVGMVIIVHCLSWFEGEFFGAMEHFLFYFIIYYLIIFSREVLRAGSFR